MQSVDIFSFSQFVNGYEKSKNVADYLTVWNAKLIAITFKNLIHALKKTTQFITKIS